jgi:hypothetical protein
MKAIDAYRDVQRELDKYESPSFSVGDFNYFFPLAVSRYIDHNYKFFDVMQKEVDDIRSFLTLAYPLTLASGKVSLPETYRHMLHVKVAMKFKTAIGRYSNDQVEEFYPDRLKSGQKGFRFKNAFSRPNYKQYYYEIAGTDIQLVWDSTVADPNAGVNLWIDFVKEPDLIYLNPDKTSDFGLEVNNTTLQFNTGTKRNYVYFEIIGKCREVFLENIESPRFPVAAQQNQQQ